MVSLDQEILFIEEIHEYWITSEGGTRLIELLPSVSEIIAPLKDFSMIPADVLEAKRQFGTAVHKMIALYLENDLDEDSLTADQAGCLEAFKQWQHVFESSGAYQLSAAKIEKPQHHKKLKYAGTPDIDTDVVIDIKTRLFDPILDPLQLSAYKNFSDPNRPGYILTLFPDGTYKFVKVPEKQSWQIFRKLLKHYRDEQAFREFVRKVKEHR